jgi:hypothetical protein
MGQYAHVAIEAQKLANDTKDPHQAWETVAARVFGKGTFGYRKGCPKETFLGLCEEGRVKGIPQGEQYTKSNANKLYALTALEILKNAPNLKDNKAALWRKVMKQLGMNENKCPNQQMDVVVALWLNGLVQ